MFTRSRPIFLALSVASLLSAAATAQPDRFGYSFNEGTQAGTGGLLTDYYGALDGNFAGTWSGDLYFRPGFSGEERDFSITSGGNRVRINAEAAFGAGGGSFTAEVHFTIGEATSFRQLIGWQHSGGFRTILGKSSGNQFRTALLATGDLRTVALEDGRWYHGAVVYDVENSTTSLYLDGTLVGSGPSLAWDSPTDIYLAASHTGGGTWNGFLDNVRITNAVLAPENFLLEGFGSELTEPPPPVEPPPGANEWQLFWTELDLGQIETARGDGTDRGILVTGLNRPISVQADPENSYLYWSEDGVATNTVGDGRIARANLDGTNVITLYAAADGDAGLDNPQYIALHTAAGLIYWVDHQSGVYRAPIDGSGPVQEVYIANWSRYTNLALDLVNNHVYFGSPETGELWRTDLDGGNFTYAAFSLTGTWAFNGLDLDPATGRIYYPDTGVIKSADFAGGNVETLATGLELPLAVVLGPDNRVFFTERLGQSQIGIVNTDGTGQQPLITGLGSPFGLAVIQVDPPTSSSFDQWRQTYFDAEELNDSTISGPDAAPAGDGIPNLLKYAFGLGDPKTPAANVPPTTELVGDYLEITFPRAKEASDVQIDVEVSTNLVEWASGGEVLSIDASQDPEIVTVRVLVSGSDRVFIRLGAVQISK